MGLSPHYNPQLWVRRVEHYMDSPEYRTTPHAVTQLAATLRVLHVAGVSNENILDHLNRMQAGAKTTPREIAETLDGVAVVMMFDKIRPLNPTHEYTDLVNRVAAYADQLKAALPAPVLVA